MEVGSWELGVRSCVLGVRSWDLEVRSWELEVGIHKLGFSNPYCPDNVTKVIFDKGLIFITPSFSSGLKGPIK